MGKDNTNLPKNWPPAIPYLIQPQYSSHITKEQLQSIRTRPSDLAEAIPLDLKRGPSAVVKITPISISTHPANGQAGLFAARDLRPGSLIVPYYGVVHSSFPPHSTAHESSDYDLWLDHEADVAVDAANAGNEARFVNDYRGVGERPNAEFKECWDERRGERCMAVFVLPVGKNPKNGKGKKTGREGGIKKGEEILVSYGKGFWGKRAAKVAVEKDSFGDDNG